MITCCVQDCGIHETTSLVYRPMCTLTVCGLFSSKYMPSALVQMSTSPPPQEPSVVVVDSSSPDAITVESSSAARRVGSSPYLVNDNPDREPSPIPRDPSVMTVATTRSRVPIEEIFARDGVPMELMAGEDVLLDAEDDSDGGGYVQIGPDGYVQVEPEEERLPTPTPEPPVDLVQQYFTRLDAAMQLTNNPEMLARNHVIQASRYWAIQQYVDEFEHVGSEALWELLNEPSPLPGEAHRSEAEYAAMYIVATIHGHIHAAIRYASQAAAMHADEVEPWGVPYRRWFYPYWTYGGPHVAGLNVGNVDQNTAAIGDIPMLATARAAMTYAEFRHLWLRTAFPDMVMMFGPQRRPRPPRSTTRSSAGSARQASSVYSDDDLLDLSSTSPSHPRSRRRTE